MKTCCYLATLSLLFLGLAPSANAAGGDTNPNANYLQQLNSANHRPSFTTWTSRHRSFPQVNPKNQASLWCFMKTDDGRILNLQAICGDAGNA